VLPLHCVDYKKHYPFFELCKNREIDNLLEKKLVKTVFLLSTQLLIHKV
jgi:hypothetical protein